MNRAACDSVTQPATCSSDPCIGAKICSGLQLMISRSWRRASEAGPAALGPSEGPCCQRLLWNIPKGFCRLIAESAVGSLIRIQSMGCCTAAPKLKWNLTTLQVGCFQTKAFVCTLGRHLAILLTDLVQMALSDCSMSWDVATL